MNYCNSFIISLKCILVLLCIQFSQNLNATVIIDSIVTYNIACNALKGKLVIYASGATDIKYSIDVGENYVDSNTFTDLAVGDYLIIAIDENTQEFDIKSVQLLNLTDEAVPSILCPLVLEVDCGQQNPMQVIDIWKKGCISEDHLGNVLQNEILTELEDKDFEKCGEEYRVEFTTSNLCGTENRCWTSISVIDNTAPIAICPSMLEIDVKNTSWPDLVENWLEELEFSDNCNSDLRIENSFEERSVLLTCDPEFSIDVEFSVEDLCENSSICNSTIKVYNELEPVVICDQNLGVSCGEDPEEILDKLLLRFEDINAFDEDITVVSYSNIIGLESLQCGDVFYIEFTIEDHCNRMAECTSNITIDDLIAPEVSCPLNLQVLFSKENFISDIETWKNTIVGSDNCGEVSYSSNIDNWDYEDYCGLEEMEVEFNVSDACGNLAEPCIAKLTIENVTVDLSCPALLVLECGNPENEDIASDWIETAIATANSLTGYSVVSDYSAEKLIIDCSESIPITFELKDECLQIHSCQSNIDIIDNLEPTIFCPEALVLEVWADDNKTTFLEWLETSEGQDNCGPINITYSDLKLEDLECNTPFEIAFTASDLCQNSASCVSSVILNKIELDCPPLIEVLCGDELSDIVMQQLLTISLENNFSGYDFDTNVLNLDCQVEYEYEVTFYKDGLCYEGEVCNSILKVVPVEIEEAEEPEEPIVEDGEKLFFPNILSSRSSDNRDHSFTVFGREVTSKLEYVQIYNRWGTVIWETSTMIINDPSTGWSGVDSNGKLQENGTYLYIVKVKGSNDLFDIHRGSITLLN